MTKLEDNWKKWVWKLKKFKNVKYVYYSKKLRQFYEKVEELICKCQL